MLPRGRGPLWFDERSVDLWKGESACNRDSRALFKKPFSLSLKLVAVYTRELTKPDGRKGPQGDLGRKGERFQGVNLRVC